MNIRYVAPIAMLITASIARAQVTAYEAPGNLEATNPLECVYATEVTTNSTAAEVAAGARACANGREYDAAAELFMVASAFAYFDTRRVADETAHAALGVLPIAAFGELPEERLEQVFEAIEVLDQDLVRKRTICAHLRNSKPPTYIPTYMIAHGMNAFVGSQAEPLIEGFDEVKAWNEAMEHITCD